MDLEFYNEEKHDYFLDTFTDYSREPTEEEEEFFRPELEQIVEDISEVTGQSDDFKLYYAMTDEDALDDDLPINRYVHGFSFAEWMEGFDRDVVMIRAVNDREDWRPCLVNMLAHEMAHQEYYSKNKTAPYTNLQNLVFEGHAMNRAEQVAEELDLEWSPHYRSEEPPEIDSGAIIQVLDKNRNQGSEDIFSNGGELCEQAEGYQIAYLTVDYLVNEKDIGLGELPGEESLREEVEEALTEVLN
ncbi:hypothetical protein GKQ38_00275 [Candidatus Nanohaloarchaea archaeon]|nr:hypothetical protein GKQ38_00275 [Candidatus Nanohaloarchaea archaeon]